MEIRSSSTQEEKDFLERGLEEHSKKFTDQDTFERDGFGFFAYDKEKLIGGISGRIMKGSWVRVDSFYVDPTHRGNDIGTKLMQKVEEYAVEIGCIGVTFFTLSFEAHGFYEKLGYVVYGELKDYPVGFSRFELYKRLDT
ncbi:MAG: GNAT family N-acetyltransferase [Firmicutes bacterium]|nr:GNAT family N-acetyltransferase [Bacillota bacterium]